MSILFKNNKLLNLKVVNSSINNFSLQNSCLKSNFSCKNLKNFNLTLSTTTITRGHRSQWTWLQSGGTGTYHSFVRGLSTKHEPDSSSAIPRGHRSLQSRCGTYHVRSLSTKPKQSEESAETDPLIKTKTTKNLNLKGPSSGRGGLASLASTPRNAKASVSVSVPPEESGPNLKSSGGGLLSRFLDLPKDKPMEVGEEWITVYRFPHIRLARVVQRIKIYQTVFTVGVALPVGLGSFALGTINEPTLMIVLGASALASAMLWIMGRFASKLIGIIYVTDKDPKIVRVAHMTFWGNRVDDIHLIEDLIPLSELPDNVQDTYIKLRTYSDPSQFLYLTIRHGTIYDDERFFRVFGNDLGLIIRPKDKK